MQARSTEFYEGLIAAAKAAWLTATPRQRVARFRYKGKNYEARLTTFRCVITRPASDATIAGYWHDADV